jgi:hypothetical protein
MATENVRYQGVKNLRAMARMGRIATARGLAVLEYTLRGAASLHADQVASFSGHFTRVVAAPDLLKQGIDTAAIMRAGGWEFVNVLARYLEKAEHNVWA